MGLHVPYYSCQACNASCALPVASASCAPQLVPAVSRGGRCTGISRSRLAPSPCCRCCAGWQRVRPRCAGHCRSGGGLICAASRAAALWGTGEAGRGRRRSGSGAGRSAAGCWQMCCAGRLLPLLKALELPQLHLKHPLSPAPPSQSPTPPPTLPPSAACSRAGQLRSHCRPTHAAQARGSACALAHRHRCEPLRSERGQRRRRGWLQQQQQQQHAGFAVLGCAAAWPTTHP